MMTPYQIWAKLKIVLDPFCLTPRLMLGGFRFFSQGKSWISEHPNDHITKHTSWQWYNLALKLNSYCCASSRKPPSLPVFTNLPLPCPSLHQSIPWFCIEILAPGEKVQQCIIRYCHSELCPAIGSWVNWIQMNALQVIWILTTAIHVIWIQAVQLKNGANSGDVNPSQGGPAFWPAGGARVTHRDYRGIAHCWPWLATRPQFLPKPFLRFWRHVSLGGHLGRDRSGTVWRFSSQDFTNLIYYIC